MLMLILLSLIFIGIIAYEVPMLIKKKMWRELAAFSVLLIIGMFYSYGQALELPLPNPTKALYAVTKPFSDYIEKILS